MDQTVADKIDGFFAHFMMREYPKGHVLIQAQEDPTAVIQLMTGRVKQYDISSRGEEIVLNVYSPPAFFPMSYAINKTPNLYFYEAETDVMVRQAPVEEVIGFIKANPDVAYDLLSRVYRGTDGMLGRMAHLMASSAKSRVAYELLIESRRFGKSRASGVTITLSEGELGGRTGLARETVNREIHKLKQAGLIAVDADGIVVKDFIGLSDSIGRDV